MLVSPFIIFCLIINIVGTNSEINEKISDKYFIFTKGCQMRSWPVSSSEIKKIYEHYKIQNCKTSDQVIKSIYNETTERYYLHYLHTGYKCKYCPVDRQEKSDKELKPILCVDFDNDFEVPPSIDALLVKCTKSSLTLYDGFAFIQKKKFQRTHNFSSHKLPSILILGIDSLSRINFRRTMPKSYAFLSGNHGFIELLGYNKVDDNTFPNLMAILTGLPFFTVKRKCRFSNLNNCNFIWDSFKRLGYITAYAEDAQDKSSFTYNEKGFREQPTDFYFKPIGIAMERYMDTYILKNEKLCIGNKFYADYIYDYGFDFATHYNSTPTFGMFWTNSFSHGAYDTAGVYDENFLKQLERYEEAGIFENSIVFVFSDHGYRHGDILKLNGGFSELRLPFFFVRLPGWFKKYYPTFNEALKTNGKRLVSNYDIHQTFKHIINLYSPKIVLPETEGCKHCKSLFYEFPENRTCSDAGIVQSYCTCNEYFEVKIKNEVISAIANGVVQAMNNYLFSTDDLKTKCSELSLYNIISAKRKFERKQQSSYTYNIEYIVKPYNASFQAIVEFEPKQKKVVGNVEEINRLDSYKKTANCIHDKELKKYCICKNSYLYMDKNKEDIN